MRKLLFGVLLIFAVLLCAGVSRADSLDGVTFTLVNANLTGTPGSTLTWQYDVTNNSGGTIFANSINAGNFTNGTPDASAFDFFNFFTGIANNSSLIGPLYSFTADPSVMNSLNTGVFDLSVLLSSGTSIDLFSSYSATIAPRVAEPPASLLVLVGFVALALGGSWKKKRGMPFSRTLPRTPRRAAPGHNSVARGKRSFSSPPVPCSKRRVTG